MDEKLHIKGNINDCEKLYPLNPLFEKAFAFLRREDLAELPPGKYAIDGEKCWANLMEVELKERKDCKLETHRRYIDIQAPITGKESIGIAKMDDAAQALPFDEEKDYVLYDGEFEDVVLSPGEFAVFFPPLGAHAPCGIAEGSPRKIRKVVVKVAVG